jgi:hypothetical protein
MSDVTVTEAMPETYPTGSEAAFGLALSAS